MTKLSVEFSVIWISASEAVTEVKLLLNNINAEHCEGLKLNTRIFARHLPSGSEFQFLL